jgi:hypothetical protein
MAECAVRGGRQMAVTRRQRNHRSLEESLPTELSRLCFTAVFLLFFALQPG